eukprot:10532385-Lingulodinium_polyedra.AAC.1
MGLGRVQSTDQLRRVSVTQWAQQHAGVADVRDQREVLTLAAILDHINADELACALDTLVQRVHAIQAAKSKGGKWDDAQRMELIP